ncbi:MAG: HPr family phosphocarrier protein [Thermodesulfobacteriota bacterium]
MESQTKDTFLKRFTSLLEKVSKNFFRAACPIKITGYKPTKHFYTYLLIEADLLEVFLDDVGARKNKEWVYFAELIASIRNLAIAASHLKHILDRYEAYKLDEPKEVAEAFIKDDMETLEFLNDALMRSFIAAEEEGIRHGIKVPDVRLDRKIKEKEFFVSEQLPCNISEEEIIVKDIRERMIDFARRFRKVAKVWREEGLGKKYDKENVLRLVPDKIDEKKIRKFKNIIHGVQSDYDTYIRNTKQESENKSLMKLRGYVAVSLHLFEVAVWLIHFFERHENKIRQGEVKERISHLVDKVEILDRLINFVIFYIGIHLEKGNIFAEEILTFCTAKACYKLPIPQPQGFHARPATYVSLIVNEHGSDVFILIDDHKFNAKSVLNIMEAGWQISEKGYKEVYFEGDRTTLDDLKILSHHNYCEDEDIPKELNYLRILRNF